jgi:hypothetical protein
MEFHNKIMFLLRIEVIIMLVALYLSISGFMNIMQFAFITVCLMIGAVCLFEAEKYH